MTLSKPIQSQILIDKFDYHSSMETKEIIFPEYNNNKLIDGPMAYVIDGNKQINQYWDMRYMQDL